MQKKSDLSDLNWLFCLSTRISAFFQVRNEQLNASNAP